MNICMYVLIFTHQLPLYGLAHDELHLLRHTQQPTHALLSYKHASALAVNKYSALNLLAAAASTTKLARCAK
jgi:hypothetical protein